MKKLMLIGLLLVGCGGSSEESATPVTPPTTVNPTEKNIVIRFESGDVTCVGCGREINAQVIVYTERLSAQEFEVTAASGEHKSTVMILGSTTYDLFINGIYHSSKSMDFGSNDTMCVKIWYIPGAEFIYQTYYNQPSYCY